MQAEGLSTDGPFRAAIREPQHWIGVNVGPRTAVIGRDNFEPAQEIVGEYKVALLNSLVSLPVRGRVYASNREFKWLDPTTKAIR